MNGKNSVTLKPAIINKNKRDLGAALFTCASTIGSLFNKFKLKDDLLASHYVLDTLLPKLPQEAHLRVRIIKID